MSGILVTIKNEEEIMIVFQGKTSAEMFRLKRDELRHLLAMNANKIEHQKNKAREYYENIYPYDNKRGDK